MIKTRLKNAYCPDQKVVCLQSIHKIKKLKFYANKKHPTHSYIIITM